MKLSTYPEAVNLPFNFSSLKSDFEFRAPATEQPQESGTWAIIQGNNAILQETDDGLKLPCGDLPGWLTPQQPRAAHRHLAGPAVTGHNHQQQPEHHGTVYIRTLQCRR